MCYSLCCLELQFFLINVKDSVDESCYPFALN